jgi:hypothetical protein
MYIGGIASYADICHTVNMGINYSRAPRVVPTAQELVNLPTATLTAEIAYIEAVIINRYQPNGSFAELVDEMKILGKEEKRVMWADLMRYRAVLYTAQALQASENKNGGIGMLDVNFHDHDGNGRCGPKGGWGY